MGQTPENSDGHAETAGDATISKSDASAGTGQKSGAPRRASKEKEEEKGKQRIGPVCVHLPAAEVVARPIAPDTAEPEDCADRAAGAAADEAGQTYAGSQTSLKFSAASDPTPAPAQAAAPEGLAFAGRLVMTTPENLPAKGSVDLQPGHSQAAGPSDSQAAPVSPGPAPSETEDDGNAPSRTGHARTAAAAAARMEHASGEAQAHARPADEPPLSPPMANDAPAAHSERAADPREKTVSGPAAPAAEPEAKNTTAHGPVRQISLELNNGDARVGVRLSERRGEVLVSVRTPDARLAGDLRGDLPSLAARLEQTGLHAAAWHSDSGFGQQHDRPPNPQPQDGGAGGGERQGRRRDDRPQEQGAFTGPAKEQNRKDFAWFMTSLG